MRRPPRLQIFSASEKYISVFIYLPWLAVLPPDNVARGRFLYHHSRDDNLGGENVLGSPGGEVEAVARSALGFTAGLAKLRFNALSAGSFLESHRTSSHGLCQS